MPKTAAAAFACLCLAAASPAARAESIPFGASLKASGWTHQTYLTIRAAEFSPQGDKLNIRAESAASLIWKPLPQNLNAARKARWSWSADQAVPPVDLTRKGGDDRVAALYFIFGEESDRSRTAIGLLRSETVRTLVYVYGGGAPRGAVLPSPHLGARGKFVILRPANAAAGVTHAESVDLAKDFARAFGGAPPPLLLGLAISTDSDDTKSVNSAMLSVLSIE